VVFPHEKGEVMIEQAEYLLKGRLNGSQRNKVKGLLNMLYTPKELAEEIGISKNQIYRVYLPAGCPNKKDSHNRLLIHGTSFKEWYEVTYKKVHLEKDQAWCVSCKKVVTVSNPERKQKDRLTYDLFLCPVCGKRLAKIIDAKRKKT
jgi:predicted RNA-binding Zn-ribbon protein involved in translation (DUF1610 family)